MQSKKPSPQVMKAALYTLAWSRDGQRALGVTRPYGRSKGRLCYDKNLRIGLCRFMGLKRKQVKRHLDALKNLKWIHTTDQFSLKGKLEYRISPAQYITPAGGEKFIKFNLARAGRKSFDILGALEKALKDDSHPAEHDATQLKFNIPDRTRRYRKNRHKTVKQGFRQKVTPVDPFSLKKKNKTTLTRGKNYDGSLFIKLTQKEKLKIPWYSIKQLSEFQKIRSGIAPGDRAVWHRGQVFRWNPAFSGYELVSKCPAKSDPPVYKPPESLKKKDRQKVTHVRPWKNPAKGLKFFKNPPISKT